MSYEYTETDFVVIATQEFKHHPKANLIDFYKLFFQSYYGQGHFVLNDIAAKRQLESELIRMNSSYYPYIQDISNRNGLYRISLDAIKKHVVPLDDFLLMFVNKKDYYVDWFEWTKNWRLMKTLLIGLYPDLNVTENIDHCEEIIRNKAMVSHSEAFRLTYNPHYRVMQLTDYDLLKFKALRDYL